MGHTPGPWTVAEPGEVDEHYAVLDGFGHTASVYGYPEQASTAIANASLIAAAPELLDACKLVAACLGDWIEVADRDADTSEDERRLAIAYAAIAKAEGRSE